MSGWQSALCSCFVGMTARYRRGRVRAPAAVSCETVRGFTGTGTYRMREGYPVCDVAFPTSQLLLKPDEIVATLQKPPAEVTTYTVHIRGSH